MRIIHTLPSFAWCILLIGENDDYTHGATLVGCNLTSHVQFSITVYAMFITNVLRPLQTLIPELWSTKLKLAK